MRLVLVRHGEAEAGLRHVIAGRAGCTGLTERGRAQVWALAERLRASAELAACQTLLCSPVPRACQTAEILATALPLGQVQEDCDLCELHPGEADGLAWDAYAARYGAFDLLLAPSRPFSPGGESWSGFLDRVRATLHRLAARFDGRTVVAVTHAGFIVASILVVFDIPRPGTRARLDPDFASLTDWQVSGGTWTLLRYNDVGYLPR